MVSGSIQFGAVIGSLSMGILVRYLPYWYLFNASLCALIIGNILYAVSYTAWHLLVAELIIGLYLGSYLTLSYSYSINSSVEYSQLQQENNKTTHSERESSKMRDLLFGIEGMGRGIGFFIGPGSYEGLALLNKLRYLTISHCVLFVMHSPIIHPHSIIIGAWLTLHNIIHLQVLAY